MAHAVNILIVIALLFSIPFGRNNGLTVYLHCLIKNLIAYDNHGLQAKTVRQYHQLKQLLVYNPLWDLL